MVVLKLILVGIFFYDVLCSYFYNFSKPLIKIVHLTILITHFLKVTPLKSKNHNIIKFCIDHRMQKVTNHLHVFILLISNKKPNSIAPIASLSHWWLNHNLSLGHMKQNLLAFKGKATQRPHSTMSISGNLQKCWKETRIRRTIEGSSTFNPNFNLQHHRIYPNLSTQFFDK